MHWRITTSRMVRLTRRKSVPFTKRSGGERVAASRRKYYGGATEPRFRSSTLRFRCWKKEEWEQRFVRRDGRTVVVNARFSLIRDAAARPQYVVFIKEETTEKKQAE